MSVALEHRLEGPADAPVVILANSLGTTLEIWDPQAAALAERFRVLRFNHRGHGATPAPPGPYTIDDLATDALGLLDQLGIGKASFCGISIGGMTGLRLAIEAPDRIERLALCSSSAHMPPRDAWIERAATVRSQGMGAIADAAIERWFTPEFADERPDVVGPVRRALVETSAEAYASCCEAIASNDLRGELERIRAPTLAIVAADDPATPPPHARLIREAVPDARLVELDRGRHLVNLERPEAVTAELLAHLTEELR